jgi:hypothetical protein
VIDDAHKGKEGFEEHEGAPLEAQNTEEAKQQTEIVVICADTDTFCEEERTTYTLIDILRD